MFTQEYTTMTVIEQPKAAPRPTPTKHDATTVMAFTEGEWRAFKNGLRCALVGCTYAEMTEARLSWSTPHRWAFDLGYNGLTKTISRPDVQVALHSRFGSEEV